MKRMITQRVYGLLMAACCTAFMFSCQQDEEIVKVPKQEPTREEINFLVNAGFNEDDIVLNDGIFIIDNDILISRAEVNNYIAGTRENASGKEQHYRGPYLVSDTYVRNVKFFIGSAVPADWATAIRGAVNQWNAVNGTKLYMSIVTSSAQANTIINTSYSNENWVARAYLPSYDRRPGHTMTINTRFNYLNSGYKLFTIVHEMGHIVGLYHTDQTQGYFIQGTPTSDANSVMNSFILPWNGFTAGDIRAIQILYPQ